MDGTVLAILDAVRESLPAELVADEEYERIAVVAGRLPVALTNFYGLECRLGPLGAGVDIAFETRTGSEGQRLLAGRVPSRLDEFCGARPAWRDLRAFAKLWADANHRFHRRFHNVWLEFDTGAAASPAEAANAAGQPCIFLGFAPPERTPAAVLDAMPEALTVLTQGESASADLGSLVESLPKGAQIFQIGLMLARPERGLRVCVSQLDVELVPAWLTETGWQGDIAALDESLRKLTSVTNSLALDLDLTDCGPAGTLGIECYAGGRPEEVERWQGLLALAEELGLCRPEKRQALLSFTGATPCPRGARRSSDGALHAGVFRSIHHLKLSFAGGQLSEAKAYLALRRPGIHYGRLRDWMAGAEQSEDPWLIA